MATYVVKARKTALKANFSASATQLTLNELLDSRGDPIVMASFGDWFALVIKQGSQVEIVKCDGLTQNGNGSATCDVATNGRNIAPIPPYTGSASGFTFLSGAEVIVTNDPLTMMYYLFNNENTWLQKQTFSVAPESSVNAVTANALVRKSQLDSAVLGVITSVSVVVQGIAGVTVADGDLIYFDTTADAWLKCDADTASTVNNVLLGIAQGSATIGNLIANGVMLRGTDDAQTGMSAGDIMYASNTAGDISNVAGTVPVAVGIAKSATELYFEPRFNTGLSQNQVNALVGNHGSPSSTNKFVTQSGLQNSAETYAVATGSATTVVGTFTVTIATPADFTLTNHGLIVGDKVTLATTGALPTGLAVATTYYVISAGLGANTFRLSATLGGSAINTSGTQSGTHTLTLTTNRYTLTFSPVVSSLTAGLELSFKTNYANTGQVALIVNGLTPVFMTKQGSTATDFAGDDIANGQVIKVKYDGTNFQMVGEPAKAVIAISSSNAKKVSSTIKSFSGSASTPDTIVKQMTVRVTGVVKVTIVTAPNSASNYPYAIFKNGVNQANWTYASGTANETQNLNLSVAYGDLVQFVFKGGGGNYSGIQANFKDFTISYDLVAPNTPTIDIE